MSAAEGSTVIGRSIVIRGDVSGGDDLLMDGQIKGSITVGDGKLTVGAHARVEGEIRAREITVLGNVLGNLHASGRVELRGSAIVEGDIFASRLSIEEDATVKGRAELIMGDGKGGSAASAASAKSDAGIPAARAGA